MTGVKMAVYSPLSPTLVALTEGQNELPAGTYTVQKCEHNGKDVCTYTHTSGATTHQKTCLACGNKWDEENCSFDENGKCACEAVLAVALKDNAELTYTQRPGTTEPLGELTTRLAPTVSSDSFIP